MNAKILHISTYDNGGAGLACLRLHLSLLDQGVDSTMLVAHKTSNYDSVIQMDGPKPLFVFSKNSIIRWIQICFRKCGFFLNPIEKYNLKLASIPEDKKVFYTYPISNYDVASHPLVKEADIIHLHWIENFVNYPTFFKQLNKPILWTLHDLNSFYGGFHHERLREKYYQEYKIIEDDFCEIKKEAILSSQNLSLVAISKEMESRILSSILFNQHPIFSIHNSVDCNQFNMIDKTSARKKLNIEQDVVFLFINKALNDSEKGLNVAIEALEQLKIENSVLVCVGDGDIPSNTKINIIHYPSTNDTKLLSLYYSCASVLLFPSFQESFGQTPLEALCCGTPVIMFSVGISNEVINQTNGIICPKHSVYAFSNGIKAVMQKKYNYQKIREDVIERFNPTRIANQYLDAYTNIINNNSK